MFDLCIYLYFTNSYEFKECRLGKLSPVRANNLNLINHYMLYKKNMTSYKYLAFIKFVTDAIDAAARLVIDLQ